MRRLASFGRWLLKAIRTTAIIIALIYCWFLAFALIQVHPMSKAFVEAYEKTRFVLWLFSLAFDVTGIVCIGLSIAIVAIIFYWPEVRGFFRRLRFIFDRLLSIHANGN